MNSEHRHRADEDLLELALRPGASDVRRELADCVRCLSEFERAVEFLARTRRELVPPIEFERAARVANAALARSTREDLSWRGGVAVWRRFAFERLRESRALRGLAAAIVVQLLALPVLAFIALRGANSVSEFQRDFPVPSGALITIPPEPERTVDSPDVELPLVPRLEPSPLAAKAAPIDVENALVRTRFELATLRVPKEFVDATPESSVGELLVLRARFLRGVVNVPRLSRPTTATGVEAALWADILLDRFAVGRGLAPELGALLERLERNDAERPLSREALARAAHYGILADRELAASPLPRAFAPSWFADLDRALSGSNELVDPTVRRWLEWGKSRELRPTH